MKIICLKGGLGNQMFEYCRYKMIKEKAFLYYDSRKLKQHHNILISDVFSIDMPKNSLWIDILVWSIKLLRKFQIASFLYDDEKYEKKVILIDDYCQDYKFIQKAHKYLPFKEFKLNKESRILEEDILKSIYPVAIHIRRGDYLTTENMNNFGICSIRYYEKAISYITDKYPKASFFIFSDDILWCKSNLSIENATYVDLPTETPDYISLYLMTKCKGHIIANSTFSFWGAYLAPLQGINIYPQKWFANKNWNIPQIFPKHWLKF